MKLINEKNECLCRKALKEIFEFVGETPQFYPLAWDFSRKKEASELEAEGSDYFPQILIKKEDKYYLLQVEETWGGGINVIFEPSPVRPGEYLIRDDIVNKVFVRPTFTWAEYLEYANSLKVGKDLTSLACEAMGIDY